MAYVLHVLLALVVPTVRELGVEPLARPGWGWTVALLVVPYVLAHASRRAGTAGRFRLAGALELATRSSAPALQAVAVLGLGWYDAALAWIGGEAPPDGWPGAGLALAVLPYLLFELAAIDAHARLFARSPQDIARHRAFHLRLFLATLTPFGLFLGVAAAIGANESWRVHLEEVQLLYAGWTLSVLGVFAWLLPRFLRLAWSTTPIAPGWVRSLLDEVATRAGFRCRDYVQWNTGGQVANAAIVGVTAGSRVVFFTDALLARMGPRELAAVFAHEIGHARHHHAFVFTSYAFFLLLGAGLAAEWLGFETESLQYAFFGGTLVVWYVSFGYLSRRFELEADLVSLDVLGEAEPLIDALEEVSGAHARSRSSWRHFSTAQRVAFLQRVQREPGVGRSLRRRLRVFAGLGVAGFLAVAGITVSRFVDDYPAERAMADLRLGHYEEVAAAEAGAGEVDPRLFELARRGAELPLDERTPAALEELALRAAREGDWGPALDLVELALLRGGTGLDDVRDDLEARERGDRVEPRPEVPDRWRAALGAGPP